MVELRHQVISTFLSNDCKGLRDLSVCPTRTSGDNDLSCLKNQCRNHHDERRFYNNIIISIHLLTANELAMTITTTMISRKQRQLKDKVTLHSINVGSNQCTQNWKNKPEQIKRKWIAQTDTNQMWAEKLKRHTCNMHSKNLLQCYKGVRSWKRYHAVV